MKTKHVLASLIASLLVLFASSAMAQQQAPRNALRAGESALSFAVPSGGNPYLPGTLGYHYMLQDNMRLGINLGLTLSSTTTIVGDQEESATAWGLDLAPQLNYYTDTRGTVAPYFFGQVLFSTFNDGNDASTGDVNEFLDNDDVTQFNSEEQTTVSAALGLGVEWFPVTRFSISGQVGLGVDIIGADQLDQSGLGAGGDPTITEEGFGLGLFTSRLAANIYF